MRDILSVFRGEMVAGNPDDAKTGQLLHDHIQHLAGIRQGRRHEPVDCAHLEAGTFAASGMDVDSRCRGSGTRIATCQ